MTAGKTAIQFDAMNTATLEQLAANIPPKLTAKEHNAFPQGRFSGVLVTTPIRASITDSEAMELLFCEERIERGLETFLEVGQALIFIREKRLYRVTHETFEAYCEERWDIKASRARQLCAAADVVMGLKDRVPTLPTTESQVRPLVSLPPDQQQTIWREAVATAPNGKPPTRKLVEQIAARVSGKTSNAQRSTSNTQRGPIDAGTRAEQIRAAADKAIASVRELLDLQGTPDSEAASDVVVSLGKLETFKDHLQQVAKLQSARS